MAVVFIEGFDKYGPVGTESPDPTALMTAGEWTTGSSCSIVNSLSGTGFAMQCIFSFSKTLVGNYPRLIAGMRINTPLTGNTSFAFRDNIVTQCTVGIAASTGRASVSSGNTTLASTPGPVVTAGVTHYLECDVTFTTTGHYSVWLDGVLILDGNGNLRAGTTNNYANVFIISCGNAIIDDLYLFDATGTTNNAALLTSPRVETTFPISDEQTQFSNGASLFGDFHTAFSNAGPGANGMCLSGPYTHGTDVTLNSISFYAKANSTTGKVKGVIYPDNGAGTSPSGQTLIASTNEVVGWTSGSRVILPFASPVPVVGGTQYWLGIMTDTSLSTYSHPGSSDGHRGAVTYTSGAPAVCPATSGGDIPTAIWGDCTGSTKNWVSEHWNGPPFSDTSYMFSDTPGTQDYYEMSPLINPPQTIYAVAAKAFSRRSDNGARTINVHTKSSGVDASGTDQTPGTTYTWTGTYFETDPNTGTPWTRTTLDAALSGPELSS